MKAPLLQYQMHMSTTTHESANIFKKYFIELSESLSLQNKIFTTDILNTNLRERASHIPSLKLCSISEVVVYKIIVTANINKASGIVRILTIMFKLCAPEITK